MRSTHERSWRLHTESGQLGGDLRQSLVDPGLLSDVLVEVNGVLQLVRDYGKVGINPMLDRACVQVDDLAPVAMRMHFSRERVLGPEVASSSVQRGVDDYETVVAVKSWVGNVPEG